MINQIIDRAVTAVAPKEGKSSVHHWITALVCIPMVLGAEGELEVRTMTLLLANIWLRLTFPSSYFPATAVQPGILASPMTARCVAFASEFSEYEVWAAWAGVDFWSQTNKVWLMVLIGEVVSTLGVLLQSESLLCLEDSIWMVHAFYMAYFSLAAGRAFQLVFFVVFGSFMVFTHLPRRFGLWLSRGGFEMNPLYSSGKVLIRECDFEERAWVVPMLLLKPVLTTVMFYSVSP